MWTLEQKTHFWTCVDIKGPEDCWEWLGRITPYHPYRVAYCMTYEIDELLEYRINHTCENPSCCNPIHLCCEHSGNHHQGVTI